MAFLQSLKAFVNDSLAAAKATEAVRLAEQANKAAAKKILEAIEAFKKFYGDLTATEEQAQMADEAFYVILGAGEHQLIADAVVGNPKGILGRPGKLQAFMSGAGNRKRVDAEGRLIMEGGRPVYESVHFPPAPRELVERVAEAVGPLYMSYLQEEGAKYNHVSQDFWVRGEGNPKAEVAEKLSCAMQGLLNIATGLGDKEAYRSLCQLFLEQFGQLPPGVYYRVKLELGVGGKKGSVTTTSRVNMVDRGGSRLRRKINGRKPPILRLENSPAPLRDIGGQLSAISEKEKAPTTTVE